jgi:protein-disulfide isomerase-like protein with CxxC motif
MTDRSFSLSFDYRCPFANIIHQHVITALHAGAQFEVEFVPWTLSQGHRAEGDLDVWDDDAKFDQLVSLAAGVSVRDLQPDKFLDAHSALFRARHEQGVRLGTLTEVLEILEGVGVDQSVVTADIDSRRPFKVIGDSFRRFERYEAFGVPTFVVDDDAVFVRYMNAPTGDGKASIALIESIVARIEDEPALNEFKHTRLSA